MIYACSFGGFRALPSGELLKELVCSTASQQPTVAWELAAPAWRSVVGAYELSSTRPAGKSRFGLIKNFVKLSSWTSCLVRWSVTKESHLSFSLSLHAFGQSSEHHSRKSIPIRAGAVWCSHFILTHSPLMSMHLGLTFLNNRGWQPTSCFFQISF